MKATINGIEVEGTKEEIAELLWKFGTKQQSQPLPQLPNPPYTGTGGAQWPWGKLVTWNCGNFSDPNSFLWN